MSGLKSYRVLIGLALLLASGSIFLSAALFVRLAQTTERTNAALCTFRADVRQRADATTKFLLDHPKGIPGIPPATLKQGLVGQRRTVAALGDLECPENIP